MLITDGVTAVGVGMISGLSFLNAQQCRNLRYFAPSHHCQSLWLAGKMTKVKVK
ncbi:hypothetical protein yaldo0001_29320 [Yersinia aldovae ATCC 35236]|nr:hypothetical protein yaldo0001_29320 [Yersinia aldovae ATCC 35236]